MSGLHAILDTPIPLQQSFWTPPLLYCREQVLDNLLRFLEGWKRIKSHGMQCLYILFQSAGFASFFMYFVLLFNQFCQKSMLNLCKEPVFDIFTQFNFSNLLFSLAVGQFCSGSITQICSVKIQVGPAIHPFFPGTLMHLRPYDLTSTGL